ncbi:RNase H domain-containing protein [Trichonephila clavipes]|nr:RNase H domain-containing protein [Trichonephila clavipes]
MSLAIIRLKIKTRGECEEECRISLTYSCAHLSEWWRQSDKTTTSIVQPLNSLSANVKIFFHWVPSHVHVCRNEIADGLACEGCHKDSKHDGCLTFSEIATQVKQDISSFWRQAPVRERYERNRPGASLFGTCSRRDETILARLHSEHT